MADHRDRIREILDRVERLEMSIYGDPGDLDKNPGLIHEARMSRKQSERNTKILVSIFVAVVGPILVNLIKLVVHAI